MNTATVAGTFTARARADPDGDGRVGRPERHPSDALAPGTYTVQASQKDSAGEAAAT